MTDPKEVLETLKDSGYTGDFGRGWQSALEAVEKSIDPIREDEAATADFAGFTAKDLEDWFNQEDLLEDGWGELSYSLKNEQRYDYDKRDYVPLKPFVHGEVAVEDDEETGGEGSQEDIYVVFSVTEDIPFLLEDDDEPRKRYFQKTGYYQSYDGSNWDGEFTEVWPKEVKVTRWVSKKP